MQVPYGVTRTVAAAAGGWSGFSSVLGHARPFLPDHCASRLLCRACSEGVPGHTCNFELSQSSSVLGRIIMSARGWDHYEQCVSTLCELEKPLQCRLVTHGTTDNPGARWRPTSWAAALETPSVT